MTQDKIQENADESEETQETDLLLALAGTLQWDVTDIGEHHDDYISAALLAELWGDEEE